MNKIIAPMASQWATIKIPKGTKCYDSSYGGSITSESTYFNFTDNGKVTAEDYTVTISNVSMTDIMFNYYAKTNEGYVKIDNSLLKWRNSEEESKTNPSSQSNLYIWLTKPLMEYIADPNYISGYFYKETERNLLYIKTKSGVMPDLKEGIKLTRFSWIIITTITIAIIGLIWNNKRKHK